MNNRHGWPDHRGHVPPRPLPPRADGPVIPQPQPIKREIYVDPTIVAFGIAVAALVISLLALAFAAGVL